MPKPLNGSNGKGIKDLRALRQQVAREYRRRREAAEANRLMVEKIYERTKEMEPGEVMDYDTALSILEMKRNTKNLRAVQQIIYRAAKLSKTNDKKFLANRHGFGYIVVEWDDQIDECDKKVKEGLKRIKQGTNDTKYVAIEKCTPEKQAEIVARAAKMGAFMQAVRNSMPPELAQ